MLLRVIRRMVVEDLDSEQVTETPNNEHAVESDKNGDQRFG